jgi:predicted small secreted protein
MAMTRRILLALAIVAAALLAGCSSYNNVRGRGDADVGQVTSTPVEIIEFPDWFANVAHHCDGHGHRIFVSTRDAPPVVIADTFCPGGAR